jgi:hypothetical protein
MWRVTADDSAQTNDGVNSSGFGQNLRSKWYFECTRNPMFHDVIVGHATTLKPAQCAIA